MNGDHNNAVAGPSTLPRQPQPLVSHRSPSPPHTVSSHPTETPPLLYLPPPVPPPPRQHLAATQDLLARFHLLPAYDRYVRPFVLPGDDPTLQQVSQQHQQHQQQEGNDGAGTPVTGPGLDKGKGRERDGPGMNSQADADLADGGDGDDDDAPGAKGEKKKKNSYKHLIKGVPGKHSLKKDDYLSSMMLVPPKQRMRIRQFDAKTQEDAFTVSLEGLKGWNVNALFLESAQAREDRKKRKELKRLAKLGLPSHPVGTTPTVGTPQPQSATSVVAQPQPVHPPISAAIANPRKVVGAGTPKPSVGTPRPASRAANGTPIAGAAAPSTAPPANTTGTGFTSGVSRSTVPRPGSTVPRPGSTVPRPGSAVSASKQAGGALQQQRVGTPVQTRPATPMDVDSGQRGKKRERDDNIANGVVQGNVNPYNSNGVANGNGNGAGNGYVNGGMVPVRTGVMNAKAGTGNIRPRPIKKQRMDMQGQARDATQPVQQQPTPQGV